MKSQDQMFGQVANSYRNFTNLVWNNRARYGQLPPQGLPASRPFMSTGSYSSNEPMPFKQRKFDLNTIYEAQHCEAYQHEQDPNYNQSYPHQSGQGHSRINGCGSAKSSKSRRCLSGVLLISKCLSAILSALMESSMVYMMYKFGTTRDISGPGVVSPWSKNTKLWPTILLAVASGLTCLMSTGSLVIQMCKSLRKRSKPAKDKSFFTIAKYAVHIGTWACVAVAYRLGKTGQDLWGWSCSDKARAIQETLDIDLNFTQLCMLQVRFESLSKQYD